MSRRKPPEWIPIEAENERTCLFCDHYRITLGTVGYSELTPGSEFWMACLKQHWVFKEYDSEAHYRGCLITARTCADYQFNPEILVQIGNK